MLRIYFLISLLLGFCATVFAQKIKVDSLQALLAKEKKDSNKVTLMWNLASAYSIFKPEMAQAFAYNSLSLAQKIKFKEGESRSLGVLANSFIKIGNYPRALEFYIQKLKLEEKGNNPRNLASVIMSIGIVHVYQEEYRKALPFYFEADSIISENKIEELKNIIALNIGDVYNRMGIIDTAALFFNKSLQLSIQNKDVDIIGAAMVGLGHTNFQQRNYNDALLNYKGSLNYLGEETDEDMICEAKLGLAKLYNALHNNDSSKLYARQTFLLAKKDDFLSWQLESANFLNALFKQLKNTDSAYAYLTITQQIKDSISSKERIQQAEVIFSNEQLRQLELAQNKLKAKAERFQQLQMLFIGIFIPGLFLITLFLSRRKIHIRVIRFMGIISLLILFEYLTLLLHPYVLDLTNHIPVFEILIFVCMAAILVPAHHRIERLLIEKLTHHKHHLIEGNFLVRTQRLKIKKPSE